MGNPIIEIAVSQGDQTLGSIRLELYPDKAPGTVQNFLSLVDAGFYLFGMCPCPLLRPRW